MKLAVAVYVSLRTGRPKKALEIADAGWENLSIRTTGSTENYHIAPRRVFLRQRVKCVDGLATQPPMKGKGRIASVGLGPLLELDITPTPPRGDHPKSLVFEFDRFIVEGHMSIDESWVRTHLKVLRTK
jgi:hypothetical protein